MLGPASRCTAAQIEVGLDVTATMLRAFGPVIKEVCAPGARGVGIDLSFEERRERASRARTALLGLAPRLNGLARHWPAGDAGPMLGQRAADLALQLAAL